VDVVRLRVRAKAVRFAVDLSGSDAAAGDEATVAGRPVIAAAGTDVVGRRRAEPGGAAEFADGQDQRPPEQAAVVEAGKQGGGRTVEHGTAPLLQHGEVIAVRVPGAVGSLGRLVVRPGRPGDLDEARAGLDETPGQQAGLAKPGHAELLAELPRLLVE